MKKKLLTLLSAPLLVCSPPISGIAESKQLFPDVPDTKHFYVTFQFESGDQSEFPLSGSQYGMLAENDTGMHTHSWIQTD